MTKSISNSQDVIDSRDVIARIEELRGGLEFLIEAFKDAEEDGREEALKNLNEWLEEELDSEEAENFTGTQEDFEEWGKSSDALELLSLEKLAEEAEGSPDWRYGKSLIRDSYFTEYAEQFAEDIGADSRNMARPCTYIDWDAAADALKQDYTEVDFDGISYFLRA